MIANQVDVTLLSVMIISKVPNDVINQNVTIRLLPGQSTGLGKTEGAADAAAKSEETPSGGATASDREGAERRGQHRAPNPPPGLELPATIGGGTFAEFELKLEVFGRGAMSGWLLLEFETARIGHPWEWNARQFAIVRNISWCVVGEETALNPLMDTFVPSGWRAFERPLVAEHAGRMTADGFSVATFDCSVALVDAGQDVVRPDESGRTVEEAWAASALGHKAADHEPPSIFTLPIEEWMPELRKNMLAAVGSGPWIAPNVQQMSADALMDARQGFSGQYRAKMHAMLVLEELQHIRDIRRFDLFNVRVRPKRGRHTIRVERLLVNLRVPGLVEKRISVNMNDRVLLRRAHRAPGLRIDEVNAKIPYAPTCPNSVHADSARASLPRI